MKRKLLTVIYIILVMVILSMNETYSFTHKIFKQTETQEEYSKGMEINSRGFLIHLVIFIILISFPVFVKL
jgi:hypothetical protein